MQSIVVAANDVQLSYIDSGIPSSADEGYTTFFLVHGSAFTAYIFERLLSLGASAKTRFVAINRRDYPGSTPLTPDDHKTLASGTDEEKALYLKARGLEVASFIDQFVVKHGIPPVSEDGKYGGFVLVGWSLGNTVTLSTVANVDSLDAAARSRWASHMRALVLHEPPTVALGTPLPAKVWSPLIDQSLPEEYRAPMFSHWVTSSFKHGDLSKRDPDLLSYILPTTSQVPTIYKIPQERLDAIVYPTPATGSDLLLMLNLESQLYAAYKKACFDKGVRELLPKLRVSVFTGDASNALSYPAFWAMEEDNKAHGGGMIHFQELEGFNHFVHWDDPALALKVYLNCAAL
ncbi:alpha/beta-hydrolase [Trametes coccinea BRFM310]|uniref:Alpha/beta-hydrolase n=1 Tax=Trametes coccinea (strain BRFM310) TaxID=1353009 RepID=A0A1Y2J2R3_TRAC3|nr:alpha/beta-hydrolase [Trametes coccinea BRFM310]